jgi:SNF2 family DNA or RNA helicase
MKKLYTYQEEIVNSQKDKPSCALFMDMGTGKTVTSLSLFKLSNQPKILIICILSKLNDWKDDLLSECEIDATILNKGTKKNDETLSENKSNAYIINFESAWRLKSLLKWVDKNTYIIIDESHKIKSIKSNIGKFCAKLKTRTKTKCILTGTPQSRGFVDYYNQLLFVDILNVPFKVFSDAYCVYDVQQYGGFPFKKLVGYKNKHEIEKIINDNCVFFKRDIDNEQIPSEVDIKLDKPKQYEYFKRVRIYEDYAADNSSKLFVTLRKLCSGNIDKYEVNDQKIKWLEEFCEDLSYRLVIFYNFNFEKDKMIKLFDKLKIPYSQYNGHVKDLTNFNKYENSVVLCQYMSASLGLNDLVKSNVCIMFSPSTNYTDYIQSKKRIDRIGQTKKPLFYNLYCKDTVEEQILKTIKKGADFDLQMFDKYMKEVTK